MLTNFRRSVIIKELWRPEVARLGKMRFCAFWKNDLIRENCQNSVPTEFIATPIDVLCSIFIKFGRREIGKVVRYLPDKKNKISPGCKLMPRAKLHDEDTKNVCRPIRSATNSVMCRKQISTMFNDWQLKVSISSHTHFCSTKLLTVYSTYKRAQIDNEGNVGRLNEFPWRHLVTGR